MSEATTDFVALTECHLLNPAAISEAIGYYPETERWWKSVRGVLRAWSGPDPKLGELPVAETLIRHMDAAVEPAAKAAPSTASESSAAGLRVGRRSDQEAKHQRQRAPIGPSICLHRFFTFDASGFWFAAENHA